jgi:hypothetical protein
MKQLILKCTVLLCIGFTTGCKNNNTDNTNTTADVKDTIKTTEGTYIPTIAQDSLNAADAAIINYGAYCKLHGYQVDSTIRAWLIRGTDFLYAMGLDTINAAKVMGKAKHPYIHAYIGLSPLPLNGAPFNQQLYLTGAEVTYSMASAPVITDFPEDGVYNLTMPCPKACVNRPDSSLYAAFDTGYYNIPVTHSMKKDR